MIRITDQYVWNIIFSLFFLSLLVIAMGALENYGYKEFDELSIVDFALIALASQRVVRLFVYDLITKFFREQFYDVHTNSDGSEYLKKPLHGPRRTVADLMGCVWCFGMWATVLVAFLYLLTPLAFFPVLVLALSSIASLVQITASLLGNHNQHIRQINQE